MSLLSRLKNVGKTVIAAVDFNPNTKVIANTPLKGLNKVLETVANHPFATAGVIAGGLTSTGKSIITKSAKTVTSAFSKLKTSTQLGIIGTSAIVGGAAIKEPAVITKSVSATVDAYSTATDVLAKGAGGDIKGAISEVKEFVVEHPIASVTAGVIASSVLLGQAKNTVASIAGYSLFKSALKSDDVKVINLESKEKVIENTTPKTEKVIDTKAPAFEQPNTTPTVTQPIASPLTTPVSTPTTRKKRSRKGAYSLCKSKHLNKVALKVALYGESA